MRPEKPGSPRKSAAGRNPSDALMRHRWSSGTHRAYALKPVALVIDRVCMSRSHGKKPMSPTAAWNVFAVPCVAHRTSASPSVVSNSLWVTWRDS